MIATLLSAVAATPPDLPLHVVAAAVEQQFGLRGSFEPLVSERDQNFRLLADDGGSFVVKVTSAAEDPAVTDFQISALLHLESKHLAGVPRIVRTRSGVLHGQVDADDGTSYCLRMVTWLDGQLLIEQTFNNDIARSLGQRLAELDLALADFKHDGDCQDLLWDTQRAGALRELLTYIDDDQVRRLVEDTLDEFDDHVHASLSALPTQVIHNDANPENVLLGPANRITGFIDFGDMLRAPRIIDVSTAASYMRVADDNAALHIAPMVAAYHRAFPLSERELVLLFDLVRTRLAMTLSILYWRLSARDSDDPYRRKSLATNSDAFGFLQNLSRSGRTDFTDRVLEKTSI